MTHKELMKKYGPEEIASSLIIPTKLDAKQKREAASQLKSERSVSQSKISSEDQVILKLMQLRFKQNIDDPDIEKEE